MPAIPSIDEDPDAWDTLVLGGETLPGVVVVEPTTKRDFDIKKAKGKTKAKIENQGDPPRKFNVTWQFSSSEWAEVQRIWPLVIDPRKSANAKDISPLEVVHPTLALHGIRTVAVEEANGPKIAKKLYTVTLSLIEVEKPQPAPGLGGSAKGQTAANQDLLYAQLRHKIMQLEVAIAQATAAGEEETALQLEKQRQSLINQMGKPSSKGPVQNV